ncbi:ATP-binding protein [Xanthomonas bromi]|nr:ATP-binding protein [Xanthomonas bromi]
MKGKQSGVDFIEDPMEIDEISATVCGFLNARGGVIFVGANQAGEIVGVGEDPESVRRRLESQLKEMIAPTALFTLSVDVHHDLSIISIEVPQGRDVPYVVEGRVFLRYGKATVVADPARLRKLVQVRSIEAERWERRPSMGLGEEDLDNSEIGSTVEDSEETSRFAYEKPNDIYSVLQQLGLTIRGSLTNACDVLYSRRPPVRHPQCRVRVIQFESDKIGVRYSSDQWLEGPLVKIYMEMMDLVGAQVRVQAFFARGEHVRKDIANYSIEALREGIVNALAHRDYSSFSGGLSVSIYPSRIEVWNSGRLPRGIKVGDLGKLHPSIPINPDIAHVLYLRRLMERVGRGTQKIIAACEELGAKPPKWQDSPSGVTLTLYSALDAEAAELSPRQALVMEKLRPGDTLRLADYIADYEVSERQARRDLKSLEEAGFLKRSGRARATIYQRTGRTI